MEVTVRIRADSQVYQGIIGKVTLGPSIMLVYADSGGAVHLQTTPIPGAELFSKKKLGLFAISIISAQAFQSVASKTPNNTALPT